MHVSMSPAGLLPRQAATAPVPPLGNRAGLGSAGCGGRAEPLRFPRGGRQTGEGKAMLRMVVDARAQVQEHAAWDLPRHRCSRVQPQGAHQGKAGRARRHADAAPSGWGRAAQRWTRRSRFHTRAMLKFPLLRETMDTKQQPQACHWPAACPCRPRLRPGAAASAPTARPRRRSGGAPRRPQRARGPAAAGAGARR